MQYADTYIESSVSFFNPFIESEQIKCELFDADNDNDLDIYLASGGVEVSEFSESLYDQLFINDGKGNFSLSPQKLPTTEAKISTGAIAKSDIDSDGDIDLFVGERSKIGNYGQKCSGYILLNDGKGIYKDKTSTMCKDLEDIGMITDAIFTDLDGDKKEDLVLVGEYMDVTIFKNKGKGFEKVGNVNKFGWWNVVKAVDVDNDNDMDLILGNHGLNSRFHATEKMPLYLYFHDFDNNGFAEGIVSSTFKNGTEYPFALRQTLVQRIPSLKKKFPNFETFKSAAINEVFDKKILEGSIKSQVNELQSLMLINEGNMNFKVQYLPTSVQLSPIYAIATADINNDGYQDLIMGGNLYGTQPEVGRYDASYGHILINNGKGSYIDKSKENGFSIKGEIRDIHVKGNKIIIFRNNDSVLSYQINI
jgi:hypothetical protein